MEDDPQMSTADVLRNSVIVVAHPDDEILWFSSLIQRVGHVVICYLGELANADFGRRREEALSHYPLREKMSCLEMVALGAPMRKSFLFPKFSRYGVELADDNGVPRHYESKYVENYYTLGDKLTEILTDYQNVLTHNPWGEYGHEEHVQVYRAVKDLQQKIGYDVWFSNYCSTRTAGLMARMLSVTSSATFCTDSSIAQQVMDLYKRTGCWTWYDDWQWPREETFFKEARSGRGSLPAGSRVPINLIVMPSPEPRRVSRMSRVRSTLKKLGTIVRGSRDIDLASRKR